MSKQKLYTFSVRVTAREYFEVLATSKEEAIQKAKDGEMEQDTITNEIDDWDEPIEDCIVAIEDTD